MSDNFKQNAVLIFMRVSLYACLTLFSFGNRAFADSTPTIQADCVPHSYLSQNWPVAAIYMHGLFEVREDTFTDSRKLELQNRQWLEQLAIEKRIRIALPLAPNTVGVWRKWNNVSLNEIERLASEACDGAPLIKGRDLIGFSNGAINSQKFRCEETENYSHVISIGATIYATEEGNKTCNTPDGRFHSFIAHDFKAGLDEYHYLIEENMMILNQKNP